MIRVENLTKSFGGRLIFNGIGFSLNSKERVGLVGQNGHGKTTLFRLINGEDQPNSEELPHDMCTATSGVCRRYGFK